MASLSGIEHLYADRLSIRKPRPTLGPQQDVFTVFLRNPESLSYYVNQTWSPVDKNHVPNVEDVVSHMSDNVGSLSSQIQLLQDQVASLRGHVFDSVTQIGTLQSQMSSLQSRVTTLEARVNEDESQQNGLWANVETILTWINTAGAILSRIEAVLVAAGLL
jgi:chromosome segregation ATPase